MDRLRTALAWLPFLAFLCLLLIAGMGIVWAVAAGPVWIKVAALVCIATILIASRRKT